MIATVNTSLKSFIIFYLLDLDLALLSLGKKVL